MTRAVEGLLRPRRLAVGDRVGLVATSAGVQREQLEQGLEWLRKWGLEPVAGAHVLDQDSELGYLAGTDEDRARDLQEAWCDPANAAVLAVRGGYGMQRVVDMLDWEAMRAAGPKLFAGYSDLTVLHEALAQRLHLASLHAPMVTTGSFLNDAATRESLYGALFEPETAVRRSGTGAFTTGQAHGVTLGGNLSLLAAERGTPHARPSAAGGILLLEDVNQPPYSLDRTLTQLLRSGWFDRVAGVALGQWTDCGPPAEVRAVLRARLAPLGVPVVEGFAFGHEPSALSFPLGVPAVLDARTCTLTYDTAALT